MSIGTVAAWRERAARLFPGGVNSPVRAYRAVGGEQPIMVRGQAAFAWDADGNRYIDYVGAFGPLMLGHAYPAVVEAIRRRPAQVNIIATGRDAPEALVEVADTVTEMVNVRHAYDRGIRARRGIDF